jgi:hypothetical protein
MEYVRPRHTREEVDAAGTVLLGIDAPLWKQERSKALAVVNNWRSSHSFPQNTLWMTLSNHARRIDPEAVVVQRIKRRESIINKLERFKDRGLSLSEMQDLGGCRAIVDTVKRVYTLAAAFSASQTKNKLLRIDDYIHSPKKSGYRGIHLIYEFRGRKASDWDGLNIEVQLRSTFMHTWATAVEMVDIFSSQRLKVGSGDPGWAQFFALMGSFFASIEGNKRIPHTPRDNAELVREIRRVAAKLRVLDHLEGWRTGLQIVEKNISKRSHHVVLSLDYAERATHVWGYRNDQLRLAQARVRKLEEDSNKNVVLIGVGAVKAIRKAYPNYFMDTGIFMAAVADALGDGPVTASRS